MPPFHIHPYSPTTNQGATQQMIMNFASDTVIELSSSSALDALSVQAGRIIHNPQYSPAHRRDEGHNVAATFAYDATASSTIVDSMMLSSIHALETVQYTQMSNQIVNQQLLPGRHQLLASNPTILEEIPGRATTISSGLGSTREYDEDIVHEESSVTMSTREQFGMICVLEDVDLSSDYEPD